MDENDKEQSQKENQDNFYLNFDKTTAPGFGMGILINLETENENEKYQSTIYSVSKSNAIHSEIVLIEKIIIDFANNGPQNQKNVNNIEFLSNTKKEKKNYQGIIYIYINNSPCFACLERYHSLNKNYNINFEIFYTQYFEVGKIQDDIPFINSSSIYKVCRKIIERKPIDDDDDIENEIKTYASSLNTPNMVDCVNEVGRRIVKSNKGLTLTQLNLNEGFIGMIKQFRGLMHL